MNFKNLTLLGLMLIFLTSFAAIAQDEDNMKWEVSWSSPVTLDEPDAEVPVPFRAYNSEAWFDFDGDGNKEFYIEDQTPYRGFVYEADGNDKYVYRWHIENLDTSGANILIKERCTHGTDCDGDGADELIHMHTVPTPAEPNHIPPIRIFKHEAGSAEFLPDPWNWTVAWDAIPTGREDLSFRPEYYTDAGDFDNDGKGEFAINYKRDPLIHFAIVEVTPPLTPEEVTFNVELQIDKEEYMKPGVEYSKGYNSCRIDGEDLDGDGMAEFFLFNRETPGVLVQCCYYVDCTGPDTYDVHAWHKDDDPVVPVPHIRAGENYTFVDLDGDGTKEIASFSRGYTDDVGNGMMALWVAKINPMDPANVLNIDDWYLIATVDEMLGLEPGTHPVGGGWIEGGDADKDGYADVYFGISADGMVMDAEFVGDDLSDPASYNFYPVINLQETWADTNMYFHSARSAIGDGDGDGNTDIVLFNKQKVDSDNPVPRPGVVVLEFGDKSSPTSVKDNDVTSLPKSFELHQNYPNPFNPTTTISYELNRTADVRLDIFDVSGRLVKTLVNARQSVGSHNVIWNGTDLNSNKVSTGIYFYSLVVNSQKTVKKMTLIK